MQISPVMYQLASSSPEIKLGNMLLTESISILVH